VSVRSPGPPPDIRHVLDAALDAAPDRCALIGRDRRFTYAELDAESDAAAAALCALGVGQGDRVAASLPNDTAVVVAFHAVMRLGAVWVGLNQLLPPSEMADLVEDSGARVFLCDSPQRLGRAPSCLEHVVVTGGDPEGIAWAGLVDAHRGGPVPRPELDPDAPAAIAYTSGTTGRPKGVVHSQAGLLLPGASLVAARGYTTDLFKGDCLSLTILNLLVLSTLLVSQAQGTCVVMDSKDAPGIARWISSEGVNTWNGVPTMLYDLVHDESVEPGSLASLREVWSGGAPCPEGLREAFEEKFGHRPLTTYGLTEAPTVVTIEDQRSPGPPGSSGRPLPHLKVTVLDDVGHEVPSGENGEICVGPPDDREWAARFRTMVGYWRPDDAPSERRDGLLHTGDVGHLDADANLFVVDRKQLVILRGGANVYPAEVEAVLLTADGVRGCAVFGVADERLGEKVVAVLEVDDDFRAPGPTADQQDALRRYCTERLARYKVPDRFVFHRPLPRNAMGKVRRDLLAQLVR
jgi:acyl-CoA synthetase (AMP-forming)/AMP-acid ligase II